MKHAQNASRAALLAFALALPAAALAQPSQPLRAYYGSGAISAFDVEQPRVYRAGERVFFTVRAGERARDARVQISTANGVKTVPLRENEPGVYEGFYTVRANDNFHGPRFEAKVIDRSRESSTAFASPELVEPRRGDWRQDRDGSREARRDRYSQAPCMGCGRVESVRMVEENSPEANAPGMIIGGLAGGLLGNQIGGGSGRTVATVLGALAGGAVGNEVGRTHNRRMVWITSVRLDNGSVQNFANPQRPQVDVGQRVRVEGDQLFLDDRR